MFTFAGFNVVDTVLISQGLNHLFGWGIPAIALGLGVVATVIAIFGHDWLHIVFRVLFWVSLPLYVILSGAIMFGRHRAACAGPCELRLGGLRGAIRGLRGL